MIKNYTSTVPIEKTIMRIELALINGGAVGITKEYDNGDLKAICFSVPSKEKRLMSIRLPADVNAVFEILKGRMKREPSPATLKNLQDQAGRTAWKIVQEWVEIQMTFIAMRQVEFLEVFLAYVWDGRRTFYSMIKDDGFKMLTEGTK